MRKCSSLFASAAGAARLTMLVSEWETRNNFWHGSADEKAKGGNDGADDGKMKMKPTILDISHASVPRVSGVIRFSAILFQRITAKQNRAARSTHNRTLTVHE